MQQQAVPVTLGSPWFRAVDTSICRAIEARFSPGDVLPAHTHDRPILAVMLAGSFDTTIARRRYACLPECAWIEPCEERHANHIGRAGARVLVLQPDPRSGAPFEPIAPLVAAVAHVRDPALSLDARRLLGEMDRADALSRLAIDALLLGMLVRVSRARTPYPGERQPPWLSRVRELLHEEFRNPPGIVALAAVAGVTPTHLCHGFRSRMGTTVGEYVRRIRAAWAAEQLRTTDTPLSAVAAAAGYADQSHFTRECRRLLGARPSEYRCNARLNEVAVTRQARSPVVSPPRSVT